MHLDPGDPDLKQKLDSLKPVVGYCILIDIVGSTALKDRQKSDWLCGMLNTFSLARGYVSNFDGPLKVIGDALMLYISANRVRSALMLFLGLCYLVQEKNNAVFRGTKAAVCLCNDVYEVSIGIPARDYYGKDIDLTARLLASASEGEVVMNAKFAESVLTEYHELPIKTDFPDVPNIVGPWPQRFKGFSGYVSTYKLPAGGKSFDYAAERGLVLEGEVLSHGGS